MRKILDSSDEETSVKVAMVVSENLTDTSHEVQDFGGDLRDVQDVYDASCEKLDFPRGLHEIFWV